MNSLPGEEAHGRGAWALLPWMANLGSAWDTGERAGWEEGRGDGRGLALVGDKAGRAERGRDSSTLAVGHDAWETRVKEDPW